MEKGRLAQARSAFNLLTLDDSLQGTLNDVQDRLAGELKNGPERVFERALKSLNELEVKRFVIHNALESLKEGEKINDVLTRYSGMGLVLASSTNVAVEENPFRVTQALLERKSLWERATTAVAQIGVNASRTIPKCVEIEPHIGFVGPIPTVSFAIKGTGMTVYELFEALRGAQLPHQPVKQG